MLSLLLPILAFAYSPVPFQASWGLKQQVYREAMQAYVVNPWKNERFAMVVDFSQPSKNRRLYLFDLKNKTVSRHNVAVGKNSDRDNDGIADSFSNVPGSNESSLGLYRTAETYNGRHGLSLRLDGLLGSNSNARSRAIVIHGATYVVDGVRAGRSHGCPAVDMKIFKGLIEKTKGGAMLYIGR